MHSPARTGTLGSTENKRIGIIVSIDMLGRNCMKSRTNCAFTLITKDETLRMAWDKEEKYPFPLELKSFINQ
jgi:hypothetical protein